MSGGEKNCRILQNEISIYPPDLILQAAVVIESPVAPIANNKNVIVKMYETKKLMQQVKLN